MCIGTWLSFHATFMNLKTLYYLKTDKEIFKSGDGCSSKHGHKGDS